jgi:hypothetical protein
MQVKQNFVLYEGLLTNGEKILLLALGGIVICANNLQPSIIELGGTSCQLPYLVATEHWSKL